MDDPNAPAPAPADQPQHVVRTFASDMAALSSRDEQAEGAAAAPATAATPSRPTPIHEDIVAEEPSDGHAVTTPAAVPPPPEPIAPQVPGEETTGHEATRMSILDRLRARAGARENAPPATGASHMNLGAGLIENIAAAPDETSAVPRFGKKPVRPAPQPAPAAVSRESLIPPMQPMPPVAAELPAPTDSSPLHTYTSDFADRIDANGASAFSVLAAEQDAGQPTVAAAAPKSMSRLNIVLITVGALLVLGGCVLAFAAVWTHERQKPVAIVPGVPSLIAFDEKVELSGTGSALMSALAQSAADPLASGHVRVAYLGVATTSGSVTTTVPGTGGDFIQALDLSAPDILLRNVEPSSTVGIADAGTQSRAFFILKVSSYDATFRGMLSWEPTMAHDLSALYPVYPASAAPTATTSVPVTVAAPSAPSAPQFVDEVADNHDVRALKDTNGNTILLYGYYDEETLIIARDEDAFAELVGRLGTVGQ